MCSTTPLPEWYNSKLLEKNPANRSNIRRLNDSNKKALIEMLTTTESARTPEQLELSGIVRPDWDKWTFQECWNTMSGGTKKYFLSNKFIRKWLVKGYISRTDYRGSEYCDCESACDDCDQRCFINFSCSIVDEESCQLYEYYLTDAKFDNTSFYKAVFDDCTLDGATAYGAFFEKCRGSKYYGGLAFANYLKKQGVKGIDFKLYD